jgi:hypothetical protein
LEKLIERCKTAWHLTHRPTHDFWGLKFYFELRFLAYNLVLWHQTYVLSDEPALQAMSVFELVATVAPRAVVMECPAQQPKVIYLATAPEPIRALISRTHTWVQQVREVGMVMLGCLRNLRYDWQTLVDAVWQAGLRLGGVAPPTLCKT